MRITKPLIGTAAGAAVLGATLALGLSMASASTSSTAAAHRRPPRPQPRRRSVGSPVATEVTTAPGRHAGPQVHAHVRVRQVPGQRRARIELMAPDSH